MQKSVSFYTWNNGSNWWYASKSKGSIGRPAWRKGTHSVPSGAPAHERAKRIRYWLTKEGHSSCFYAIKVGSCMWVMDTVHDRCWQCCYLPQEWSGRYVERRETDYA